MRKLEREKGERECYVELSIVARFCFANVHPSDQRTTFDLDTVTYFREKRTKMRSPVSSLSSLSPSSLLLSLSSLSSSSSSSSFSLSFAKKFRGVRRGKKFLRKKTFVIL